MEINFSSESLEEKNLLKSVGKVGKSVLPVAQKILPVAATIVPALRPVALVVDAIPSRR